MAVKAFKQVFSQTDEFIGLVSKTMNTNPANPEWQAFLKECEADKRIYVLIETMDRPDVLGLIDCCEAHVSTYRAEGFGGTIAEAIMFNTPAIATHYFCNVDFFVKNINSTFTLFKINQNEYQWIAASDDEV